MTSEPAADAPALEREPAPPPAGTVEAWAWAYVTTTSLAGKLDPEATPSSWEPSPPARRLSAPGRPPELTRLGKSPRTPRDLVDLRRRAQLFHSFLHHELQAAELMCWALCAFVDAPPPFRRGLVVLFWDEVRHLRAYAGHLATLGFRPGDFPVRDWFWERVPRCRSPAELTATLGIGFEGGNLDHGERFAARLRAAGDAVGAELCARVAHEEEAHVRFAWLWFWRFVARSERGEAALPGEGQGAPAAAAPADDDAAFRTWREHLPAPLSPLLMRGVPLNREARLRAGLPAGFVERLARWPDV